MVLLEDEKLVLKWLSEYGPLTKFQLLGLLSYKPAHTAEKILRNVRRAGMIRSLENGYYALDKFSKPDKKLTISVWVLLKFIEKVKPTDHRLADFPAQIFFMKEAQAYEIVVISEGEEYLTQLLQPKSHKKYIFVVSDIAAAARIPCPDVPCIFAEARMEEAMDPIIKFYSPEEAQNSEI